MLGGPSLRHGVTKECLNIPSGIGWGGNDTGRLVTWEFTLRIDSASWKSLELFMQLISFCNSCILPLSSRIVSRSSTNFLLAIVSNVEPWNLNSSISLRLFSWASRKSQFCLNNCSWRSCISSKLVVSLMSTTNFFFLRLDHFIQFLYTSSVVICLEFVFSNLCLTVSENLLSLSLQESPNLFVFRVLSLNFVTLRVTCVTATNGFPHSIMTDWLTTTDKTTGLLLQSDRLVFGTHWGASDRWWCHRSRSLQGTVARSRAPGWTRHKPLWWSGRWAHNLWEARSRPECQGPQR